MQPLTLSAADRVCKQQQDVRCLVLRQLLLGPDCTRICPCVLAVACLQNLDVCQQGRQGLVDLNLNQMLV
jgi:hypothetical protein